MRKLLAGLACVAVAACGDGSGATPEPTPDVVTSTDASTNEASTDASPSDTAAPLDDVALDDVALDVASDRTTTPDDVTTTPDVAVDAASDAAPDVTLDAAPDVTLDVAPDVTLDVAPVDAASDVARVDATADVTTGTDAASDASDAGASCPAPPACSTAAPSLGATASWRHITTRVTVALGGPRHRGRDLFLREGEAQWAMAKFAYGINDDDLNDEDVDIYLLRGCGARWELLGTAATSANGSPHATVEGVADDGGRVYFPIPAAQRLAVGWHKLLFVVRGDHTTAVQWINVLPAGAHVVVTDVDGTLTESENAAVLALLTGPPPGANSGGADMLRALVDRGYQIFYLTARPEWLAQSTHDWLTLRGFPRGIVHTTLGFTGATGAPAQTFKTAELTALRTRLGMAPDYGFGNTDSDVAAYASIPVPTSGAFYYQYTGDTRGGTRVDDYNTLVSRFRALPLVCR